MSVTPKSCRAVILVKALPRPSKKYGETVCCAAVTPEKEWKRLYPVRFRNLAGENQFLRWQWIEFGYRQPTSDRRPESCHVFEDKLHPTNDSLSAERRFGFLEPLIVPSSRHAAEAGSSLALIRPRNTCFRYRRKPDAQLVAEREAYDAASQQGSLLDVELKSFEPSPYEFVFVFEDADGRHTWRCGDWETHAAFFNWRRRYGEESALQQLSETYNKQYPERGFVIATGNMARRPQTWQLLGVIRLDEGGQTELEI